MDKRGLDEGRHRFNNIVRKCAINFSDRGGREGGKTYLKCVTFRKKLRTYEMLPYQEILLPLRIALTLALYKFW